MENGTPAFDYGALGLAAKKAADYLHGVRGRSVPPSPAAILDLAQFDETLPEAPADATCVLDLLDRVGSPATVANAGGRFFGFVNGGAIPVSVAATWLASAWDQNAALRVMSPAAAALEDVALRWVREALGLPAECGGSIVTGASVANMTGLAAARHELLKRSGWDVENDGMFGAPPLTVVVGDQVHASLLKGLGLLGLGRKRVVRVPADEQGRMRADSIPAARRSNHRLHSGGQREQRRVRSGGGRYAGELASKAHGSTSTALSDCGRRHRRDIATLRKVSNWRIRGPPMATNGRTSVTTAESRWCEMRPPYGPPCRFRPLTFARENCASLPTTRRRCPAVRVGVELWATLRSLGRRGLADLIERTCRHARRFAEGLREAGYEILNDVVINQVLVSFGEPEMTRAVIAKLQADGSCWCGGTEWQGRAAMRISVSSWATTEEDVEMSLAAMLRIAEECRR